MKKIYVFIIILSLMAISASGCSVAQGKEDSHIEPIAKSSEHPEDIILTDTGKYIGQIDSNSIEIFFEDMPEELMYRAFRLTEEMKVYLLELNLETMEEIIFDYTESDIGQPCIVRMERN